MLIGITGTIGAGKGTVAAHFEEKGFRHVSVSGFLAEEAARRGLAASRVLSRKLGNEYRARGKDALIETVLADINPFTENVVVESLHTVAEVEYVQHLGGKVIAVDAPLRARWERIRARGDGKDAVSYDAFVAEQNRQMASSNPDENNLRAAMEVADFRIENAGSENEFIEKLNDVFDDVRR